MFFVVLRWYLRLASDDLELLVLLAPPRKCWYYLLAPPCLFYAGDGTLGFLPTKQTLYLIATSLSHKGVLLFCLVLSEIMKDEYEL